MGLVKFTIIDDLRLKRKPKHLHSDMDSQYTSFQFENVLKAHHIRHSYSKKGHPYDNSSIEAFHSLLKREFAPLIHFSIYADLVVRTSNYIH